MYAKYHMLPKEELTIVNVNETIKNALEKLIDEDLLSLPVIDDIGDFLGTIRKDEIYKKYFEDNYESKEEYLNQSIELVINRNYKKVSATTNIEETSYLLSSDKTPFLPVFEDDKFIGILTHSSIFNAFSDIIGLKLGIRLALYTTDGKKKIERLAKAIRKEGGSILSLATMPAKVLNIYKIIIRVTDCDIDSLKKRLKKEGFRVDDIDT